MRRRTLLSLATFLAFALCTPSVHAKRLLPDDIPAPLRPWTDWALHGHERQTCTAVGAPTSVARPCAWPSRLHLDLKRSGGTFRQEWLVEVESRAALPGGDTRWPEHVTVDGEHAVVLDANGRPFLDLPPGQHVIAGTFSWDAPPSLLEIPTETGLLDVHIDGQPNPYPSRDDQGSLWLEQRQKPVAQQDTLEVTVHRRVIDDIPMHIDTRVDLKVSGRTREVVLGRILLAGMTPVSLSSPLPVRIEPDGRLRAQLRPGHWKISLSARQGDAPTAPPANHTLTEPGGPWDAEEIWVFEARPALRVVQIADATPIDPKQTSLPSEWNRFPAYVMKPGATMTFVEKQRGDADPPADRLELVRTWWLDFDGRGVTVRDQIAGAIGANSRLSMTPQQTLGRAALHGEDQFITRLDEGDPLGIEIRQGNLRLEADSRIDSRESALPITGWLHDFHSVRGTLNLPPGWRLFHAFGVDSISQTWVSQWTLLDIFLVLITAAGVARLWGWLWGGVALVALVATWHEPRSPQYAWIAALVAEALVRAVSTLSFPRLTTAVRVARLVATVALLLIGLSYVTNEARLALYPNLEKPHLAMGHTPIQSAEEMIAEQAPHPTLDLAALAQRERANEPDSYSYGYADKKLSMFSPDPDARAQTGPGLPTWGWNRVDLRWHGPVERDQEIDLVLLPPFVNRLLGLARIGLVITLALAFVGLRNRASDLWRLSGSTAALSLVMLVAPAATRADDFPSTAMLDELRTRLLAPPSCHPSCASSPRLHLDVSEQTMTARMSVEAASRAAVALPGGDGQWHPHEVLVNGTPAQAMLRDSQRVLWLLVDSGKHDIVLRGSLPQRDSVQIALPTRPRRVTANVSGWQLDGLRRDGGAESNLQLTRSSPKTESDTLEPDRLPPFVQVTRELKLGTQWEIQTVVARLSPKGAPVILEIPLLDHESTISGGIEVNDRRATVTLAPNADIAHWRSVLGESDRVQLRAVASPNVTERWRLLVGPMWHVEIDGIPPVHSPASENASMIEWRPWADETVTLDITRPKGAGGRTLTIDSSNTKVMPGLRATDVEVELAMRSSRGADHQMTLPSGATLESVAIDGSAKPIRAADSRVTIPVAPGRHTVRLRWRQSDGIESLFHTPTIDAGAPSVNAVVQVQVPHNRWILFAGGPAAGPVVLFWPLVALLVPLAWLLGRHSGTPLGTIQWFLLGVGLTQMPIAASAVATGALLALGWRARADLAGLSNQRFRLIQLGLIVWSAIAVAILVAAIGQGLLGHPDMQITGNGSFAYDLRWFQDRSEAELPRVWIASMPLWVYRATMLSWALWLTRAALNWLQWGWRCLNEDSFWRSG